MSLADEERCSCCKKNRKQLCECGETDWVIPSKDVREAVKELKAKLKILNRYSEPSLRAVDEVFGFEEGQE